MRTSAHILLVASWTTAALLWPSHIEAADVQVKVIVHPTRVSTLTRSEARAIYLKQKLFWDDGQPMIPINREAGSEARELFSKRVFDESSRRLATYWNQRYYEAGEFPPATLVSEEAVIRFVAENANAIGYVTAPHLSDSVAVALVLE